MKPPAPSVWLLFATLACAGCGKAGHAATTSSAVDEMPPAATGNACGHAVCGDNFFVDVAAPASCPVGGPCGLTLKLVATGEFHINEEYPYKFKANDTKGVEFLGTDEAGKNVFSKGASNWRKSDEKSGTMKVAFRGDEKGDKAIAGTFKLSVCSAQSCQLEQQLVSTTVAIR